MFNHLLLSHISTLSSYNISFSLKDKTDKFGPVVANILAHLKPVEKGGIEKPAGLELMKRAELSGLVPGLHTEEEKNFLTKVSDQFIYIQKLALDICRLQAAIRPAA